MPTSGYYVPRYIYIPNKWRTPTHEQGSPQANIKAERVGVVWAEFVTTSIDSLPTSKLN